MTEIDWARVDHVLLDMDGTVLDLWFDNRFWRELVPARYAQARGLTYEQAFAELAPQFNALRGRLEWYSLDHWGAITGLDLSALKREVRDWIAPLPGAEDFLRAVKGAGKQLWLVTNADPGALDIKMGHAKLEEWFDRILSSHTFGAPKEDPRFWPRLIAQHPFEPARALFVDDSLPVLTAARAFGIGQVVGITHPDSKRGFRSVGDFPEIAGLRELTPGLAGVLVGAPTK